MTIPTDAQERKDTPIFSGVLKYFPDALAEVARCSKAGNDQHHPDKPLHWDKAKSTDEYDALTRHLMEVGTMDSDGIRHSAKVAWRALAGLQRELDAYHDNIIREGSMTSSEPQLPSSSTSSDLRSSALSHAYIYSSTGGDGSPT